ncbi:MAG: YihY/virulence factor BrkB family protein [Candidatus Rokubacteria bacterium]|nr:YihY/virulence factor BrkB family protein [Candidatus Rokubacteria bacterium]
MFGGLRGAFSRFYAADGFLVGAGLAFFFLMTMIPLVLLGISALGFVLSAERAEFEVVGTLVKNFPVYRREIMQTLLRIVETRRAAGLVGTVILVLFSTPLFGAARLVMHRVLGVKAPAGFVRNLLRDAVAVVLMSVLLFAATVVTWTFTWVMDFVLEPAGLSSRGLEATGVAFSVALGVAMFTLAYRYLPRRRVRAGTAFAGGLLAGVLWEIAKRLFRLYVRNLGLYHQIYGPLGVLVAFVMFVYYSAVVFVFGACYVASLESRRRGM